MSIGFDTNFTYARFDTIYKLKSAARVALLFKFSVEFLLSRHRKHMPFSCSIHSCNIRCISRLAASFTLELEPTGTALIGAFDFVGCKDTPHCDGSHLARAADGSDVAASAFRAVDPRIYGAAAIGTVPCAVRDIPATFPTFDYGHIVFLLCCCQLSASVMQLRQNMASSSM